MIFVAMAPMVAPVDHMLQTAPVQAAPDEVHTAHCHNAPGACSDMPLVSGPGQFMSAEPLLVEPSLTDSPLLFTIAGLRGISHLPDVPPPLGRASFA